MKDERILRKYSEDAVVLESRTPADIILSLQEGIHKAYVDELNAYAPKHLIAAETALGKARTYEAGAQGTKAMQEAIFAEKMLQAAYVVKKNVARVMSRVFELKERLDELGSEGIFPERYGELASELREAVEAIEEGDMEKGVKGEARLLGSMRGLEIDVVKSIRLKKTREALALAEDEGAENQAPKSWQDARDAMARALLYIEKNPRNDVGTVSKGHDAYRAAQHALFITREALAISALGKKDLWEDIALEFEAHLNRIGTALGADDVRYMAFLDQAAAISAVALKINEDAKRMEGELVAEKAAARPVVVEKAQKPVQPVVPEVSHVESQETPVEEPKKEIDQPVGEVVNEPVVTATDEPSVEETVKADVIPVNEGEGSEGVAVETPAPVEDPVAKVPERAQPDALDVPSVPVDEEESSVAPAHPEKEAAAVKPDEAKEVQPPAAEPVEQEPPSGEGADIAMVKAETGGGEKVLE